MKMAMHFEQGAHACIQQGSFTADAVLNKAGVRACMHARDLGEMDIHSQYQQECSQAASRLWMTCPAHT